MGHGRMGYSLAPSVLRLLNAVLKEASSKGEDRWNVL